MNTRMQFSTVPKLLLPAILAFPLAIAGCSSDSSEGLDGIVPGQQSAQLEADLVQLREEEKLARDVYLTLYDAWQIDVFQSISNSEQKHMDKVGELLTAFEIADPIVDDTVGVFSNADLGQLYVDLVAQGMESDVQALLVGATIEDLDIFDIREMRTHTDILAVTDVYDKLECGSNNHLWAFSGQLDAFDTVYDAQFLTADEINAIVSAGHQSCGSGDGHQGGGH